MELVSLAWIAAVALAAAPHDTRPAEEPGNTRPAATRPASGDDKDDAAVKGVVESASTTQHEVTINGQALRYQATAANLLMKDEAGKLKATVFFVAYELDRPVDANPADRPITFVFNGGPGAAAVWLHLGTAGPRRVLLEPDGQAPRPPYRLTDNAFSWLDATDMVFIDPVGTGYSRPAEGEKGEQFYGVREDIRWVADFVRLYTTHYQRWASPKFLAGESYGTTRAAGLSEYLMDRHGIALNGIILISTVLDFQTLDPEHLNDLPYVLYLPSYAAIAWYHKRLPPELPGNLEPLLREVENWAMTVYNVALARGAGLPPHQRRDVIATLARYTGLDPQFIDRSDLRILPGAFRKQLLGEDRTLIGRFDARITGYDPEPTSNRPEYDPSLSPYLAIYSSTFNDYARRTLKFDSVLPYEVLSNRVHPWKFGEPGQGYLSVSGDLNSAMIKNPYLKVLFASGFFDLATPYHATDYTIEHLNLPPELRRNITHHRYLGGHMMYHHTPSLEKLHKDITTFIHAAAPLE